MQALQQRSMEESFVVLLATGDRLISEELNRVLRRQQVELLIFDNARDMLLAITERPIHLIVFDSSIELKGMGILTLLRNFWPQARVIAMEDDFSFEKQEALARAGVLYQIQKPMNPQHLSHVVEKVVEKLYRRR